MIKGYLRLGARVLGAPAWDPDFNTADLPMLMRLGDLHPGIASTFGCLMRAPWDLQGGWDSGMAFRQHQLPDESSKVRTKSPISGRVHLRLARWERPAVRRQRC